MKVALTVDEVMILKRCRKDGAPPHDLDEDGDDGCIHRRLQAMGLLDHRVGPAPDGTGPADFWSTNANGEWALRLGWREWFGGDPPPDSGGNRQAEVTDDSSAIAATDSERKT